jgi:hypothetical protein
VFAVSLGSAVAIWCAAPRKIRVVAGRIGAREARRGGQ